MENRALRYIVTATAAIVLAMTSTAVAVTADGLIESANAGRFDEVAHSLASDLHTDNPKVRSLLKAIESFKKHRQNDRQARLEAYEKTIGEMAEQADKGQRYEALVSAIKAHDLAVDPEAMLQDPQVQALVTSTRQAAEQATRDSDWLEALNLYRALDLLFEEEATYRDDVKRVAAHVRLLRLYAPKALYALAVQRAERLGKDKPKPLTAEEQGGWEQQLQGVQAVMLRGTLKQAARRHMRHPSLGKLLKGALDALEIVGQTSAMSESFPSMGDPRKMQKFLGGLEAERKRLAAERHVTYWDAIETIDHIQDLNERTVALPERVIIYEMTEGVTSTLDDFTSVIWPYDQEQFSRNTRGKFYGVGIQISMRDERLIVVTPLHGTPAFLAGIKPGDIIAQVNDKDTSGWSLDKAVREITGPEGTVVTLGIERAGHADLIQVPLKRAEIPIESVKGWQILDDGHWDYYIDRTNKIGYIRVSQFIPQTADNIDAAINQMEKDAGLDALVLDLRFNPGGLLSSAIDVTDRFVAHGDIVSTVDVQGVHRNPFRARPENTHRDLPLVVLVNQGSASASEIVSGALQDHGRALIVGQRSFGKGSVQDLIPLTQDRSASLKLTTQYYALPSKRIIHREPGAKKWGIEPDLKVRMTDDQVAAWLEVRRKADILLNNKDAVKPAAAPSPAANDADDAKQQDKKHAADDGPVNADQILRDALDPQLETALLVLRTRLVAKATGLARKD